MEPNKVNILKWVESLENDGLAQCKGRLTKVHEDGSLSHCCLGVATELAIANGVEGITFSTDNGIGKDGAPEAYRVYTYSMEDVSYPLLEASWLPRPVREWLGLDSSDAYVANLDGGFIAASTANDSMNWDFAMIAAGLRRAYLDEPVEPKADVAGQ